MPRQRTASCAESLNFSRSEWYNAFCKANWLSRLKSEMKQLVVKVGDQIVMLSLYELSLLLTLREEGTIGRGEMYQGLWQIEPNKRNRPPISASIRAILSRMLRSLRDHGLIKEVEHGLFVITLRGNAVVVAAYNWLADQKNEEIERENAEAKEYVENWLKKALLRFRAEHSASNAGQNDG